MKNLSCVFLPTVNYAGSFCSNWIPSSLPVLRSHQSNHGGRECSLTEIDPCTIIILARLIFPSSSEWIFTISHRPQDQSLNFQFLMREVWNIWVESEQRCGDVWLDSSVVCGDTGTDFPFKLSFSLGSRGHGKNLTLCPYILRDLNVLRSSLS